MTGEDTAIGENGGSTIVVDGSLGVWNGISYRTGRIPLCSDLTSNGDVDLEGYRFWAYIPCLIFSQVLRGARLIIPDTLLPMFLHSLRSRCTCDYEYAGKRWTLQTGSLESHLLSLVKFISAVMHPTIT